MDRPSLERVLAYQNDAIPRRMLEDYAIELEASRELFDDIKRWLYLCTTPGLSATIYGPLVILDVAWHNFVLFTREYTAYCVEHYGYYLHHAPTTHDEHERTRLELLERPEETRAALVERNARQRDAIVEHLGVETLVRWYVDYPQRYGDEFFRTAYKPLTLNWKPDAALLALAAEVRAASDD